MFAGVLSQYWWLSLLRGVLWIAFGVLLFLRPGISLLSLALLFGAIFLIDGVINVVNGVAGRRERESWWLLLLIGIAGIVAGILTFQNPAITGLLLLFYVAMWSIVTGVLEIVAAIRLRKEIRGEFWLVLSGLVSVLFGIFVIARPAAGALAVLWLIAIYAIVFGVSLLVLGAKARSFAKHMEGAVPA